METRAIQGLQDLALQPDRDRRQGGGQQGRQPQRQVPAPADMRAVGPADDDDSIAHLLGITLWQYQDEGNGLNISI